MSIDSKTSSSFKVPPSPSSSKKATDSLANTTTSLENEHSTSTAPRRPSNASAMSIDDSPIVTSKPAVPALEIPPKTSSQTGANSTSAVLSPVSDSSIALSSISPASSTNHSPSNSVSSCRDWRDVQMNELVQRENLVFVTNDTTVEKAFETLNKNKFTSVPIKATADDPTVSDVFDYSNLNAYLLMVMGLIEPVKNDEETLSYVKKARSGYVVPVKFAARLGAKNDLSDLKSTSTIAQAVEILGSGVHRVSISDANDSKTTIGMLSQRRLIRFIWENSRTFKSLEPFFQLKLSDIGIGPKDVVSINGDRPVIDALKIMHQDGVSSIAVTDGSHNLLGNISIVDVRLVTKSTQKHMLRSTCKHFLSTILNERGLYDGQDSYPVFHVDLSSTVGRTIAKLVATKSHRLWVVQPAPKKSEKSVPSSPISSTAPGLLSTTSGQLIGVVSLTDILNKLAHQAGKPDLDPQFARKQRRSSSSSSTRSTISYGTPNSTERSHR